MSRHRFRHPLEQVVEGLDWFVGAPLIALGCLGLIAELIRPSREGLVVFLSLAALLVGTPLLLAAVAVRFRWPVRWYLQAFAVVWLPVFYLVYLG